MSPISPLPIQKLVATWEEAWKKPISTRTIRELQELLDSRPDGYTEEAWTDWVCQAIERARKWKKMMTPYIRRILLNWVKDQEWKGTRSGPGVPPPILKQKVRQGEAPEDVMNREVQERIEMAKKRKLPF